jgi:2-polyprenyl-6-methoxyphenol hydroxylase-like FAD-dependent oxidoreductase
MMTTNETRTILVVGAGIAGIAASIALRQQGHDVTLIESRTQQRLVEEGLFLTLAPNGMNALKPLGVYGRVLSAGIATKGIELLNRKGRRLALINQQHYELVYGAPSCTIIRGHLIGILLERAVEAGVCLEFGARVEGLTQSNGAVSVTCGQENARSYDLVIGADGIKSTIRNLVFPDAPQPSYTGQVGTGGFVDAPIADTSGIMRMTFGSQAFFGYIAQAGKPVYWFNSFVADPDWRQPDDGSVFARDVRGLHKDDPDPTDAILLAVDNIERAYPIFELPRLSRWSHGNVVLIGDAAHAIGPHAGQGGSLALEDALVLANCLLAERNIDTALNVYEQSRRSRVDEIASMTRRRGATKQPETWLGMFVRDLFVRVFVSLGKRSAERPLSFRI